MRAARPGGTRGAASRSTSGWFCAWRKTQTACDGSAPVHVDVGSGRSCRTPNRLGAALGVDTADESRSARCPRAASGQPRHELPDIRGRSCRASGRQNPGRRRGGDRGASSLAPAVSEVDDEAVRVIVKVNSFLRALLWVPLIIFHQHGRPTPTRHPFANSVSTNKTC